MTGGFCDLVEPGDTVSFEGVEYRVIRVEGGTMEVIPVDHGPPRQAIPKGTRLLDL